MQTLASSATNVAHCCLLLEHFLLLLRLPLLLALVHLQYLLPPFIELIHLVLVSRKSILVLCNLGVDLSQGPFYFFHTFLCTSYCSCSCMLFPLSFFLAHPLFVVLILQEPLLSLKHRVLYLSPPFVCLL